MKNQDIEDAGRQWHATRKVEDFNKFYAAAYPFVVNLIVKKYFNSIRDIEEVKDIASEIMNDTYRFIHNYKPEYKLINWVYTITMHISLRHIYKNKAIYDGNQKYIDGSDERPKEISSYEQFVDDPYEEERLLLKKWISKMDPMYRDVLELWFIHNVPMNEIAVKLGLSYGAVNTRFYRAIDILKGINDGVYNEDLLGKKYSRVKTVWRQDRKLSKRSARSKERYLNKDVFRDIKKGTC